MNQTSDILFTFLTIFSSGEYLTTHCLWCTMVDLSCHKVHYI